MPAAPGRYWWRAKDKWDRPIYGLALVSWSQIMRDYAPELRLNAHCTFNSGYSGELEVGGGWSYGIGVDNFRKHYPGVVFWSEPEKGPEGFLPKLPGKPDWTPRDPAIIEAEKREAHEKAAAKQKEEEDERAEKIREAREGGGKLYECQTCCELFGEDEVIQIRECSRCDDAKFNGTENGRNCANCNNPFSRNVTEIGCPDCLEECEEMSLEEKQDEPDPEPPAKKPRRKKP
jgi:hypothetical protein